jgi:hypothetical protein
MITSIVRATLELGAFFIVLAAMVAGFVWADNKEHELGISGKSSESILIDAEMSENK